jgi:D-arabinose 1-dehydrogenase
VLLSYSHLCLQNSTLLEFIPHFYKRAKVGQLLAASPMSMGLLTSTPPSWHPAPLRLRKAVLDASDTWAGGLPDLAMGYSIRCTISEEEPLPLAVGFNSPEEVHECVKVWREILAGQESEEREDSEKQAQEVFRQAEFLDWSWPSP